MRFTIDRLSGGARALAALSFVIVLGCIFSAEGAFLHYETHRDMLREVAVRGLLACGMTVVIVAGGIDLSVGSVLGFVAVLFSKLLYLAGWPAPLAIMTCLVAGLTMGAACGGLIAHFRIQPFIATLAAMVVARGAAKWLSDGRKISQAVEVDGVYRFVAAPEIFEALNARFLGGNVAAVTLVMAGAFTLAWFLMERVVLGRQIHAVGGNEEAARLAGVPVGFVKIAAYAFCGLTSALAGICQAAQEYQGDPESGTGYELSAIAMVVIGGTSLNGGRGGIALTVLGVLTIGYLEKILSINAVPEAGRLVLTGLVIVAAVLFQRRSRSK